MTRPRLNIGEYYHQLSKSLLQDLDKDLILDPKDFPESWKVAEAKNYKGAKRIFLRKKQDLVFSSKPLKEVLIARSTERNYKNSAPLTFEEFSYFCLYSFGLKDLESGDLKNRFYPSGGARFSLEFYLYINNVENLPKGFYHYNVFEHSLELVSAENIIPESLFFYDWVSGASLYIFVTSVFERNFRKYAERGYRYILLEAGHVGQNLYLNAADLGLKITEMGGCKENLVEEKLDLDGNLESVVASFVIGKL